MAMKPVYTRILMVLAGVITAAANVEIWNLKSALVLVGMFVAGVAALDSPGTAAKLAAK